MRLFIGTLLSPANQRLLGDFTAALVRTHRNALRSVPDGTVHLTHVFCPEVDDTTLTSLGDAVAEAVGHQEPFDIVLGGPHVIAGGSRPRLLVLPVVQGASHATALMTRIVNAIERRCPGLSISPSKSPHVTLGRFRKQTRRSDGHAVMQTIESGKVALATSKDRIERVDIIESTLTSTGPEYTFRTRIELGQVGRP